MSTTTDQPGPPKPSYLGQPSGPKPPPPEPKKPGPLDPKTFSRFLRPDCFLPDLRATEKPEVLSELIAGLHPPVLEQECCCIHELLMNRERLGTTALGKGLAIPHARTTLVTSLQVVIGLSRAGVDYGAPDRKPVHVFFLVLGPNQDPGQIYLSFLSSIVKAFKVRGMKRRLLNAASFEELVGILEDALARE